MKEGETGKYPPGIPGTELASTLTREVGFCRVSRNGSAPCLPEERLSWPDSVVKIAYVVEEEEVIHNL
jgi:hypothetical protein